MRRNIAMFGATAGAVVLVITMIVAMPLAGAAPGNQFGRPGPDNGAGPFRTPYAGPSQTVCGTAGAGFASCFAQVLQPGSTTQQVPQVNGSAPLAPSPNTAGGSPGASVATPSGLSPSTIDSVYGFSSSTKGGAGKTIAIVDAYDDPTAASDLNAFSQQWGLPQCTTSNPCLSKVNQSGGTSYPVGNSSWDLEISLDIEWAHALAPAATILLVEANSNSFADLTAAEQYAGAHADYVSNSWGGSEF
jgi:subtilase family serine protease